MRIVLKILLATLIASSPAVGATILVDQSADTHDANPGDGICADGETGKCSLRAALEESGALPGPDSIVFVPGLDVIRVSLGSLSITDDSTMLSGLAGYPIVDGSDNSPLQPLLTVLSDGNEISGMTWRRAATDCLVITGSGNRIGDSTAEGRNLFLYNGHGLDISAAIVLTGESSANNSVLNNWVGVGGNGTDTYPNRHGIRIDEKSHDNFLDGNVISANLGHGVLLTNRSHHNWIRSNLIGPDVTGRGGTGNGLDGIAVESGASANLIGDSTGLPGNLISLNGRHGVSISASDSTTVAGNLIGVDKSARIPAGNLRSGLFITDGSQATIAGGEEVNSGNVISANGESGVTLRGGGTSDNTVVGNHIGVDAEGIRYLGNGIGSLFYGHGVLIDSGSSRNRIGGRLAGSRNVISGNWRGGVWLTGAGTSENEIIGNFIGVNSYGRSSMPNSVGVAVMDGASQNRIGGSGSDEANVISGNRADIFPFGCGVLISGRATSVNEVEGNLIGLDLTGTRALRNGSAGVIIGEGAHDNTIGGPTGNVISGNGTSTYTSDLARGVHLFGEGTSRNRLIGNIIGASISLSPDVQNLGHGVGLSAGASLNIIGGNSPEEGNVIAFNDGDGVRMSGVETRSNLVRYNRMYSNDSLAVCLRSGAQDGITAPTLSSADGQQVIGGGAEPGSIIDIYLATRDLDGRGEGLELISSGQADPGGSFSVEVDGLSDLDSLVGMAIDPHGNSSEFSNLIQYSDPTGVDRDESLPHAFAVSGNYPNPFNPSTTITIQLPGPSNVRLTIYNLLGRQVQNVIDEPFAPGLHDLTWNAASSAGHTLASGLYLAKVDTKFGTSMVRMMFIK